MRRQMRCIARRRASAYWMYADVPTMRREGTPGRRLGECRSCRRTPARNCGTALSGLRGGPKTVEFCCGVGGVRIALFPSGRFARRRRRRRFVRRCEQREDPASVDDLVIRTAAYASPPVRDHASRALVMCLILELFRYLSALLIEEVERRLDRAVSTARVRAATADGGCGESSARVHGRYIRMLREAAGGREPVMRASISLRETRLPGGDVRRADRGADHPAQ